MSHLISVYAKDLGVKVGKPVLPTHYIPIPFEKYITIHNSDKVPAKNYSYWDAVVSILQKNLQPLGIKIIQIGTQEDPPIRGVDMFCNNTTFKQSFFILKNAMLHVGIDSCPVHIASAYGVPTVSVYGHTYANTCSPVWKNKRIILEPFRKKECPSFSLNEHPKSVDSIFPEKIANSCFKLLGMKSFKSEKTIRIGSKFIHNTIDIVPQENNLMEEVKDATVRVRMDVAFNEKALSDILLNGKNKLDVVTNKPIDNNLLNHFKSKINKIIYTTDEFDEAFLEYLRGSNIKCEFNCSDKEKVADQRFKFFNFDIILEEEPEIENSIKKKIESKSSKIKIVSGKLYSVGDINVASIAKDYSSPEFWKDAEYFRFYEETS